MHTQKERTKAILNQMERQRLQIAPIEYADDGSVPVIESTTCCRRGLLYAPIAHSIDTPSTS